MYNNRQKQFETKKGCLQFVFNFFVILLLIYLFLVQVFDIRNYRDRAKSQRTSTPFVLRGEIVDRNDVKLASDKTSFNIYAHPMYYDNTPEELADKLLPYVDIDRSSLINTLSSDDSVILIKKESTDKLLNK